MTSKSGWCSVAPGTVHTEQQHRACRSSLCRCEEYGGHEKPVVERDSASVVHQIEAGSRYDGGTTKRAPDRVLGGPQSRALADCKESTDV